MTNTQKDTQAKTAEIARSLDVLFTRVGDGVDQARFSMLDVVLETLSGMFSMLDEVLGLGIKQQYSTYSTKPVIENSPRLQEYISAYRSGLALHIDWALDKELVNKGYIREIKPRMYIADERVL